MLVRICSNGPFHLLLLLHLAAACNAVHGFELQLNADCTSDVACPLQHMSLHKLHCACLTAKPRLLPAEFRNSALQTQCLILQHT